MQFLENDRIKDYQPHQYLHLLFQKSLKNVLYKPAYLTFLKKAWEGSGCQFNNSPQIPSTAEKGKPRQWRKELIRTDSQRRITKAVKSRISHMARSDRFMLGDGGAH